MRKFEFHSEEPSDGKTVFSLSGGLVGSQNCYRFQDGVRQCIAERKSRLVIDLAEVDRIDSSGVGILMSVMWSASQAGGKLVLTRLPDKVEKLLSMALLLDHIHHAETREDALAMLDQA